MRSGILLLCVLISPFVALAQQPDTVGVARLVDSLNQVTYRLIHKSNYKEALANSEAAEQLAIQKVGKESAEYARCHFYYAVVIQNINKFEEAETCLLESKDIQERVVGKEHPDYATTLYQLGTNNYYRGKYADAVANMSQAHQIRKRILGPDHPRYGESLYFLGFLMRRVGDLEAAELILMEYVSFNERTHGKLHFEYARSLSDLGLLYGNDKAEYKKAEGYQREALNIFEKTVGRSNSTYALTQNYLAVVYMGMSVYEKAEVLLLEALDTQKKNNARARHITITLNNLATLYMVTGAYDKAETYTLESIQLHEAVIGIENPNYIVPLQTMAFILQKKGLFVESEVYMLKTTERVEKIMGKEHGNYAQILGSRASLYSEMGNFVQAEQLLLESLSIYERVSMQGHPDHSFVQMALAKLYLETARYEVAEPLLLSAKSSIEKSSGKAFHNYAEALLDLTELYWKQNKMDRAQDALLEGVECNRNALIKGTQHLSERELDAYIHKFASNLNLEFSFAQLNGGISAACYDNVLFQKGFLLHTVSQVAKLANTNPAAAAQYQDLQSYRRRLAKEYTLPLDERDPGKISGLEEKALSIEKELVRTVSGYAQAIRQVRWQEVQAALKPGEAALEFIDYAFANPDITDSIQYAALLIRPGDTAPMFVPLFEKNELLPHLRGATGGNNFLKINALYAMKSTTANQKSPYDLIWKPMETALKNIQTVYCSPAGLLHYLNLAAIPTPQGKPFGDTRQLVLMGSTRSLVMPNTSQDNMNHTAYLAGGIRYETDNTTQALRQEKLASRSVAKENLLPFQRDSSSVRGEMLNYLPATAAEVLQIGVLLQGAHLSAQVDTGFAPTEETIRSLGIDQSSPRILHLATHGYFFPDPKGKKTKVNLNEEPVFKISEHPMIRSGLIMAGAKQAWLTGKNVEGQEDGILTAYEISQMNLSNTELVVLSACETGLGQVSGTEGVYGLQRAFKIAGAKYLIMSLWKVDDQSTKDFMTEFYRQWLGQEQTIPAAFMAAQQKIRAKYPSPYDWAGFVLIE